jgi:site-specific DNA-methyltransferase (adenine-specific)/adenine-specific DNA-methyltransferase
VDAPTNFDGDKSPPKSGDKSPHSKARRFILVEMASNIARDITAERVKRVAQGYTNGKGEQVEGLGGGFRFCELGEPLFDVTGKIRPTVRFADLARHVYFTETGEPLPEKVGRVTPCATSPTDTQRRARSNAPHPKSPLLGIHNSRAVCLLYNGILKDKSPDGGNALTQATLAILRAACDGQRVERLVVYGTSQRLSPARLKREGVTFKQIPYSIRIT